MFDQNRIGCLNSKFAMITAHEKIRHSLTRKKGVRLRHLQIRGRDTIRGGPLDIKNRAGETEKKKFVHQKSLKKKILLNRENYKLTGPIRGTV